MPIILIILSFLLVLNPGCKLKDSATISKSTETAAPIEVKQSGPRPSLAPPALTPPQGQVPAEATPTDETKALAGTETPQGPITMPPSTAPATPDAAPSASQPEETFGVAKPIGGEAAITETVQPTPEAQVPEIQSMSAKEISGVAVTTPHQPIATVPYEPKIVQAQTNIEIILDASGSMAAPFGATSSSKMDVVKNALYDTLNQVITEQTDFTRNMAIRLYGSKSPVADNNRQDTELAVPMGSPNLNIIGPSLNSILPQGLSPISFAISEAVKDFPPDPDADRLIVLVADGIDNTDTDPCAPMPKPAGKKVMINVIGFDIPQTDVPKLECIAKNWDGQFFLARNENEVRASLDQAVNATVPYNLKLTVLAGATPMPFNLSIYRAGTEQVTREEKGFGTKLLKLDPNSYDILIEYSASPEKRKPSKMLKGVDVLASSKLEQTINFDLGQLSLTALDSDGGITAADFNLTRVDSSDVIAQMEIENESKDFFLNPGIYDISAQQSDVQTDTFTLTEKGVEIKLGETTDRIFRFQKGTISIKGITTQKESIPFMCQVFKAGSADEIVANAAFPADGGQLPLPPGTYDLIVIGTDPRLSANPRTKVTNIEVKSAETTDLVTNFEMGTMKLAAVDGQNNKLPAQFMVFDHDAKIEMTTVNSEDGNPVQVPLPPGNYDIVAYSLKSTLDPKPSVPISGIALTADKPVEQTIKFILGTIRLRGRGIKEQPVQTQFEIYKAGMDEKVSQAPVSTDWVAFDIAPGTYDALGTNIASGQQIESRIWIRDIKVDDGKTVSHEAIFTAGKLKIIGRGPNNKLIQCQFKVFKYGTDRELVNGITGDDWEVFEIEPGAYYLEVSYHDDDKSVMLKKWINIKIGENEVKEEVLRF